MRLEKDLKKEEEKIGENSNYLPFGIQYLETPKLIGYKNENIYGYTSVTFCTFKFIPLIDDSD